VNLHGDRVVLRAIEREDLELLQQFHNDPEIGAMIEFSWPLSMADQEAFFERQRGDQSSKRLVIDTPEHGVVGFTGLWGIDWIDRRAVNGIIIGKAEARRRGYAADALETIAAAAFEQLGLRRLDARIYEFNQASLHLYVDRCGWIVEGRQREWVYRDGKSWDAILVGLTASDFAAHRDRTRSP
jgi:RimJ/RimL family protein N-acetyltransferase